MFIELGQSTQKQSISLSSAQCHTFLKSWANFFPITAPERSTITSLAANCLNPHMTNGKRSIDFSSLSPISSLISHGPKGSETSIIGCGDSAVKTIQMLKRIGKQFEIRLFNQETVKSKKSEKKIPLELQIALKNAGSSSELTRFFQEEGTLAFIKRKTAGEEASDLIYDLSLFTGRRLDWLNDWIVDPESFDQAIHFGRRNNKDKRKIDKLFRRLKDLTKTFFRIVPIKRDGRIDDHLEKSLNNPLQAIENRYGAMLLITDDTSEDIKVLKLASIFSIPTIAIISFLLGENPFQRIDSTTNEHSVGKLTLARSLPPLIADLLTYWAEISPFINRKQKFREQIREAWKTFMKDYKTSGILTLLTPVGIRYINELIRSGNDFGAGAAFGGMPLIPALSTTAQSAAKEFEKAKELKSLGIKRLAEMDDKKLLFESISRTIRYPSRLGLLIAGFLGLLEGIAIGKAQLLTDPVALTLVGELNEALINAIWLLSYNEIQRIKYRQDLKKQLKN